MQKNIVSEVANLKENCRDLAAKLAMKNTEHRCQTDLNVELQVRRELVGKSDCIKENDQLISAQNNNEPVWAHYSVF
ncbi:MULTISPECIES: hypothetical protein [unclassified Pantoea]|uniref:hypothetical protein n=1 Tax=unclassified Pantoea TaxID=2630326 RepID=UPI001CD502EC|nr:MULTISPECIES: hypothetical protein [unclassified Pantoea]MCA1179480.1 hypothetical protein [Pantoea sp. alder69]MCA1251733.1 hypothetical protein [Pantoea sp. alder70]MCA1267930.1 hypothetical protein [Pantoea sp. alder81]